MTATIPYNSSLRAVPIETTLARARDYAARLGISRVTDTTRLDRVGIPVFASIRPNAVRGSLCVNAGKGVTTEEARVGAYMEAIEYALAEYGAAPLQIVSATARDVLDGHTRPEAILDFCPVMGREVALNAPMPCVEAEDLSAARSQTWLVPAETAFLPTPTDLIPLRYFGAHSNGLASGNTLLEATVHGLAEVIERDIESFRSLRDTTSLILPDSFPPEAQALAEQIEAAGLNLYTRYQPNAFGIAWFEATVVDPEHRNHVFVNSGVGCHPHACIALVRAICEALQSRLSFIHGGRDDLLKRYRRFEAWSESERDDFVSSLITRISRPEPCLPFEAIPDATTRCPDLSAAFGWLVEALARAGLERVCRIAYTSPDEDLQVVRMIVPKAEFFQENTGRVGVRLRDYVQHL